MTSFAAVSASTAYFAYGMVIRSDIPLPELSPAPLAEDRDATVIRLGEVPLPEGAREHDMWYDFAPDATILHWLSVGTFRVADQGRSITVQVSADVGPDLIAFPLLGPVLSECLRHRGLFVLQDRKSVV